MQDGFFYKKEVYMDKLQASANAFKNLLDTQYHLIIARKGKSVEITVEFKEIDFHHLMGLGKLKDLRISRQNRQEVFSNIIDGIVTYNTICNSRYITQIENRFIPLFKIEHLFDSNNLIFRYNEKQNQFSLIQADYLLSTPLSGDDIYIFIEKKDNSDLYYCRSFFPKEKKDYTIGQSAYTMLFKEKVNLLTGEKQIQYDKLTPVAEKENIASKKPVKETIEQAKQKAEERASNVITAINKEHII